jgi:hypothetical protein
MSWIENLESAASNPASIGLNYSELSSFADIENTIGLKLGIVIGISKGSSICTTSMVCGYEYSMTWGQNTSSVNGQSVSNISGYYIKRVNPPGYFSVPVSVADKTVETIFNGPGKCPAGIGVEFVSNFGNELVFQSKGKRTFKNDETHDYGEYFDFKTVKNHSTTDEETGIEMVELTASAKSNSVPVMTEEFLEIRESSMDTEENVFEENIFRGSTLGSEIDMTPASLDLDSDESNVEISDTVALVSDDISIMPPVEEEPEVEAEPDDAEEEIEASLAEESAAAGAADADAVEVVTESRCIPKGYNPWKGFLNRIGARTPSSAL